jgi:hypothetical protein
MTAVPFVLRSGHPHPESHARPWDPPDTDLTFSPKISAKSQQLMAESRGQGGNSGFLARLDNDLKRRQVKIKVRFLCADVLNVSWPDAVTGLTMFVVGSCYIHREPC